MSDQDSPELIGPTMADLMSRLSADEMQRQYTAACVSQMRGAILGAAGAAASRAFADTLLELMVRDTETVLRAPAILEPIRSAAQEAARIEGKRLIDALDAWLADAEQEKD